MKMAVHAAMVDHMDQEIGRILDQVRAMGAWSNTVIWFATDNGASAEIMVRGDGHDPSAPPGSAATFLCLGPGFSSAANTPFRRHKVWTHEGGIATPLIVHWPAGIPPAARGTLCHAVSHFVDFVPTVLELAGLTAPAEWNGLPVPPKPGRSLVDLLRNPEAPQESRELWWCHEEHRALRQGDWKLVAARGDPWELYNLAEDRGETRNLAEREADRAAAMAARWEEIANGIRALIERLPPPPPGPAAGRRRP